MTKNMFLRPLNDVAEIGRSRRNVPTVIGGYSYWTPTQERQLDAHAGTSLLLLYIHCAFNKSYLAFST
jgi:hypothetical protein